jgi:hypothetical protein
LHIPVVAAKEALLLVDWSLAVDVTDFLRPSVVRVCRPALPSAA